MRPWLRQWKIRGMEDQAKNFKKRSQKTEMTTSWSVLLADHSYISRNMEPPRNTKTGSGDLKNRQIQGIAAQTRTKVLIHAYWSTSSRLQREGITGRCDWQPGALVKKLDKNLNEAMFMETKDNPVDEHTVFSKCMKHSTLHAFVGTIKHPNKRKYASA